MELARIKGKVVSTIRDAGLPHGSLLLVELMYCAGQTFGNCHVAYDSIGAGEGEWVLVARGSSARTGMPEGCPVDLRIVGVVDQITTGDDTLYCKDAHGHDV